MEKFLHSDVDTFALSIFVKIRISNSNLNIERGRYIKLPVEIKVITKLPNSEQSYKGKVKTHNYINRQNQSTTGKL